jgi:DNA-binding NarL/FixJ family response regulator
VSIIKTIVADDNKAFRTRFVEYLQSQNEICLVGEANNGLEAVTLCRSLEPDLVLMDVSMPVMDGVEATKQIKQLGMKTMVVFVTIHEQGTYSLLAQDLHVDGFVSKNSIREDLPQVLRKIRTALDGQSAGQ